MTEPAFVIGLGNRVRRRGVARDEKLIIYNKRRGGSKG
jgi:hypothetical protein